MSQHITLDPKHVALVDAGRGMCEQKILREYEAACVLHELRLTEGASDETIRLAEEAFAHASLMVTAAFLEFADSIRAQQYREIMLGQEEVSGVPHSVRMSA